MIFIHVSGHHLHHLYFIVLKAWNVKPRLRYKLKPRLQNKYFLTREWRINIASVVDRPFRNPNWASEIVLFSQQIFFNTIV